MLHHIITYEKSVRNTLEALGWEVLRHAAYSPDLTLSDYRLFASMIRALAEQRVFVKRCEKMARRMVRRNGEDFCWRYSQIAQKMRKCIASDGA